MNWRNSRKEALGGAREEVLFTHLHWRVQQQRNHSSQRKQARRIAGFGLGNVWNLGAGQLFFVFSPIIHNELISHCWHMC